MIPPSTAQFLATLLSAIRLYYPESVDSNLKPRDTPQSDVQSEYDFVIVGAGSAGCVLANRLSEIESYKVLLIEAGGDEDAISDVPLMMPYLEHTEKDWNYTTVKQRNACFSTEGVCHYPRGHVMGGSSTTNAMKYVRGNRVDYDGWAQLGNYGWSYDDVLPYFIKSENNTDTESLDGAYHGRDGYLNVQHAVYRSPMEALFIRAGVEFGWEEGDYNGEKQEVIGTLQYTMDGPSRESTSKAYLNPIRNRHNLDIIKNAVVSKVLFDKNTAIGVEYYRDGKKHSVLASKEVILSAGAINTPKILMLSGIGPVEHLNKHNIDVKADLPVGENLEDHLLLPIYFEINQNLTIPSSFWKTHESIMSYAKNKEGPLTTMGADVMTFLNVHNKSEPPNLQIMFLTYNYIFKDYDVDRKPYFICLLSITKPESKGSVRLQSDDWRDPPLIDPNYFAEEIDLEVFRRGFKLALEYIKTPTMQTLSPKLLKEFYPHCTDLPGEQNVSDEYIICIIKNYANTIYHPVSTARMGPDEDMNSVVTPDLRVKGFDNLRVIDASVMPFIVRGNTNAPTIMIAEKGSDIIKAQNM